MPFFWKICFPSSRIHCSLVLFIKPYFNHHSQHRNTFSILMQWIINNRNNNDNNENDDIFSNNHSSNNNRTSSNFHQTARSSNMNKLERFKDIMKLYASICVLVFGRKSVIKFIWKLTTIFRNRSLGSSVKNITSNEINSRVTNRDSGITFYHLYYNLFHQWKFVQFLFSFLATTVYDYSNLS